MEPFRIAVPEATLADLHRRLDEARWPEQIGEPWAYGTDLGWLQTLCRSWRQDFDWRAVEAELNGFEQWLVDVGGQRIHCIHQRSPHPRAVPLILIHGWPGSFTEFRHVIGPLVDPPAHGGSAEDAFHVICPSIPGYGFSPPPTAPGCNGHSVARSFVALMERLGHERYFAQGGDWGSHIATWMAALDPRCAGIHITLASVRRPRDQEDPLAALEPAERRLLEASRERVVNGLGYQEIQGTRPQTLGYGLHDSPVGLAAWIGEKFHGWTDHDGDPFTAVALEDLLTNLTVYWVTGTITSSMRLYYENRQHPAQPPTPERIETPTAVAAFPGELYLPPRSWIERVYNLVHYRVQERGGHFAALEAPELLVADVREALRPLR